VRIYFYEYSDDLFQSWWVGESSSSLYSILDKAQECSYPWRIKTVEVCLVDAQEVSQETIDKELEIKKS